MECIACGVKAQEVFAVGYLYSPPMYVHPCKLTGQKLYTTDGATWTINSLPKEVVFRATRAPKEVKDAQALAGRVLRVVPDQKGPSLNEGA